MKPTPNRHEFHADNEKATIKVGSEDFGHYAPHIHSEKWKGEAFLHITHPDAGKFATHKLTPDGKLEIKIGNRTHRFYELA